MWRKLLNAPWPEPGDLPPLVRQQATERIKRYWRSQIWPLVLGEAILWVFAYHWQVPFARAYGVPFLLIGLAYLLGLFRINIVWLISSVALFAMQGMLIKGLGGVTAISFILPYTFAAMILPGRERLLVQACAVIAFWFSLFYEVLPLAPQLIPPNYLTISYNILVATMTFQTLRFLNRLAVELNTTYVAQEVTQRSQQFLARVSHELRTPLNSVLGFAKLLRRNTLPASQAGYLAQIIEEGEQLNHLVSDLLDSAQLSAGKLTLTSGTCDVNAICQAVAEEIRSLLKPGVGLKVQLDPNLPEIKADGLRLRQTVRNLVGNAAKYTMHGEITIRSCLKTPSIQGQTPMIAILVSDTGPGIAKEQQALVFVPFVKLDGRSAGVGLGLDIALQLARLHDGDIHLESAVGQGSTFTLEIPAIPPDPTVQAAGAAPANPVSV